MNTTHAVEYGLPLCRLFTQIPEIMPRGHSYVSAAISKTDLNERGKINCPDCRDKMWKLLTTTAPRLPHSEVGRVLSR